MADGATDSNGGGGGGGGDDDEPVPPSRKVARVQELDAPAGKPAASAQQKEQSTLKKKQLEPVNVHVEACLRCDKEGKLLKCYTCTRAYHAKCLDEPPSSTDKKWQCEHCSADVPEAEASLVDSSGDRKADCFKVLQVLSDHDLAAPFCEPVDLELAPGYELFVVKPLSFDEIRTKYAHKGPKAFPVVNFILDMRRVMLNCRSYNVEGSLIWDECKLLTDILEQNIKQRLSIHFQPGEEEQLAQRTADMEKEAAEHIERNVPKDEVPSKGKGKGKASAAADEKDLEASLDQASTSQTKGKIVLKVGDPHKYHRLKGIL